MIQDPIAKGMRRANYTKNVGDGFWELKPEEEWVWLPIEPIVSTEVWIGATRCFPIAGRRRPPGRRPVNLFSGITFCHCGPKMYVPSNTPKYVCWTCRNKIPVVDLEAIYVEQLKGFFLSADDIAAEMQKADCNITEKEKLVDVLRREQDKVAEEIKRIYRLYSEGGLTADGFGRFYRPLEKRQNQLEEEIPRLQADIDVLKINQVSSETIMAEAKDLYGRWPHLSREEKQRIIESITEKIVIGEGDMSISLCYLPSSEEMTKWQRGLSDSSPPPA